MKWYVDGHEFETAREAADFIMENCDGDYYDDMLDETYGTIDICGYEYAASLALYEVDPTAYRCGRSDWEDAEASNLEWELENMRDGETLEFYDSTVLCEEETEDE